MKKFISNSALIGVGVAIYFAATSQSDMAREFRNSVFDKVDSLSCTLPFISVTDGCRNLKVPEPE